MTPRSLLSTHITCLMMNMYNQLIKQYTCKDIHHKYKTVDNPIGKKIGIGIKLYMHKTLLGFLKFHIHQLMYHVLIYRYSLPIHLISDIHLLHITTVAGNRTFVNHHMPCNPFQPESKGKRSLSPQPAPEVCHPLYYKVHGQMLKWSCIYHIKVAESGLTVPGHW